MALRNELLARHHSDAHEQVFDARESQFLGLPF